MYPYEFQSPAAAEHAAAVDVSAIAEHCKEYKGADVSKSVFQLVSTLGLFVLTLGAMYAALNVSYLLTLCFVPIGAGLLTRLFIIQHDCGHGSFFKSKKANNRTGRLISLLTFTPYDFWRRAHNMHHATSGDLDRRSIGGIDTITISEYKALSKPMQRAYRLYRNPIILIFIGTPIYTIFMQRVPFNQGTNFYDGYKTLSTQSIRKSIWQTNLALVACYGALALLFGPLALLAVYAPVLVATTWIGGWLFYVQHQFEDSYWEKNENWNALESALMGSSYYALPKIFQWFTGNIGLHHIHHLCAQIPNYKLQSCMDARPELKRINRLSFLESLQCSQLKLWDEKTKQMVSLSEVA